MCSLCSHCSNGFQMEAETVSNREGALFDKIYLCCITDPHPLQIAIPHKDDPEKGLQKRIRVYDLNRYRTNGRRHSDDTMILDDPPDDRSLHNYRYQEPEAPVYQD